MKTPKQRYWLVFHARPDESVSIQDKHANFFAHTACLAGPWGIGQRPVPPLEVGHGATVLNLKPFLGQGIYRAMLDYSIRRTPTDNALDDDGLTVTFNPGQIDTRNLIDVVIPVYIKAFDAYLVEYFDDRMIDIAAEDLKGVVFNPRQHIYRVGLVSYFDEQLCRRALNLTPAQVAKRVQDKAERADLLHAGVYIVGASVPLPLEVALAKCRELTTAVKGSSTFEPK